MAKKETEREVKQRGTAVPPTQFANMAKSMVKDLNHIYSNSSTINSYWMQVSFLKKYDREDVRQFLDNPYQYESQIRSLSRYLYDVSSHYKRLVNYFSKMLVYNYVVEPYGLNTDKINAKSFKSAYKKACDYLEPMNFAHEFQKILTVAFREDVFYGYEHRVDDSYFIQKLNPDYCKICSIEDGVYNFAFDFSYFDSTENRLLSFNPEFEKQYRIYQSNGMKRWQEIDSEKSICIKINEDLEYVYPPFCGVFESLYDIEDYKALAKAKTELDNYKLLVEEIPLRKDSDMNNDFAVDLDLAKAFHDKASAELPEQVGLILSPVPIRDINLTDKENVGSNIASAVEGYWDNAGISKLLFGGGDTNSGASLDMAVKTDAVMVFSVLRQLEKWVNRKLKLDINNSVFKFKASFLNMTIFNEVEVRAELLSACQFGLPAKSRLISSFGETPSAVLGVMYLEETLDFTNKWTPLASSFTGNSTGAVGADATKTKTPTGATEATQKNDSNNPKNRSK